MEQRRRPRTFLSRRKGCLKQPMWWPGNPTTATVVPADTTTMKGAECTKSCDCDREDTREIVMIILDNMYSYLKGVGPCRSLPPSLSQQAQTRRRCTSSPTPQTDQSQPTHN